MDRYCDLRDCWAVAEIEVVLPDCEHPNLLTCGEHFAALTALTLSHDIKAHALERV